MAAPSQRAMAAAPPPEASTPARGSDPADAQDPIPAPAVVDSEPVPPAVPWDPVDAVESEPAAPAAPHAPSDEGSAARPGHEHPHEHEHEHEHAHADERPPPHEHTATGAVAPHDTRIPARMTPLQQAGWWTLLGAVALTATTAVLGGVSAREQGRRRRLALQADPPSDAPTRETAARAQARADIERSRARGRAFFTSAVVVGSVAGATALAGVIMLVVDVARRRSPTHRRARLGGAGIEVRF